MNKALLFKAWTLVALLAGLFANTASAAEVSVAVAANFSAPMQRIAAAFEKDTGHKLVLAFGSTGKLYAQIKHGAPFEVLLSADAETPARLESEGLGIPGTRFTYAVGTLVLWSRRPGWVDGEGAVLKTGRFQRLALADPKLAPYGAAAIEVLRGLGLLPSLVPKFVQGESISQTYQFVASGNADLGFVAGSQVIAEGQLKGGSAWKIPASLHAPIRQDALLLGQGKGKPAAVALLEYLRSDKTRALMRSFGYTH